MLSKLAELQDILYQSWAMQYAPDTDDEGFTDGDVFTGEIATVSTGDHVCFCASNRDIGDVAMAEMILAAKEVYTQARVSTDANHHDDYVVPASEMDAFMRAFEDFVMKNAGW